MDVRHHEQQSRIRLDQVVLDDYRLDSILGQGSYATAYLARDLVSGHRVVVKIAHRDLCRDAETHRQVVRRFEAEFEAMTRFDHPNVALMFELDSVEDNVPALVMEYVRGSSLRELLEASTRLDEQVSWPLFEQLFSVLAAAHDAGVVHRDVSPDNVLVTHDPDQRLQLKLLDFGVAQVDDFERFTMGPVGTPRYMAPEQILGNPLPASDVFSAGALLWWACTASPYRADAHSLRDLLVGQIEQTRVPDPRLARPDLDVRIVRLLQALLSPDPVSRPTAREALVRWGEIRTALAPVVREQTLGDEILLDPEDTDFPFVEALKKALDSTDPVDEPAVVVSEDVGVSRRPGVLTGVAATSSARQSAVHDTAPGHAAASPGTARGGLAPVKRVAATPRRRTDDKHHRSGIYNAVATQRPPAVHFVLLEPDAFVRRALVHALTSLPGALDGVGTATMVVQRLMALGGHHAIVLVPTSISARDVALLRANMYRNGLDSARALIVAVRWSHEAFSSPVGVDDDVCIEDARALSRLPELFLRRSLTGLSSEELPRAQPVTRSDSFAVVERRTTSSGRHLRPHTGEYQQPSTSHAQARPTSGVHVRREGLLQAFIGQMPEWLLELADAWGDAVHCSGLLSRIEHSARRVGALALSEQSFWLSQTAPELSRDEFLEHVDALEALYIEFSRDALRNRR